MYCRISLDRTGSEAGVDRQRDACLKICADRGWTVDPAHVIVENSVSATTGKRKGYARLIDLAERGEIGVIVAWHLDRLTRKLTELEALIELSERTGVKVVTATGDMDLTTDSGRLVGRILASVARGEIERKSARQRAAWAQQQQRGDLPPGLVFGYDTQGQIVPEQARYVVAVFERFAAGAGIAGLARWLNSEGVRRPKTTREWTRTGVRGMLANPRYIAERWRKTGSGIRREYMSEGNWEPIVSRELFATVQARLRDPARTTTPGNARKWLGSGLYRCGVCDDGTTVQVYYQNYRRRDGTQVQGRRYKCQAGLHLIRKADDIDHMVEALVAERLRQANIRELVRDDTDAAEVTELTHRAGVLRTRLDSLAADYADGLVTSRQLKIATDRIQRNLAAIDDEIAKHGQRSAIASIAGADDPAAGWLALDVIQRAAVVETLCTVTLLKGKPGRAPFDPESVRIEWRQ